MNFFDRKMSSSYRNGRKADLIAASALRGTASAVSTERAYALSVSKVARVRLGRLMFSALIDALRKSVEGASVIEQPRSYSPGRCLLSHFTGPDCLLSEMRATFCHGFGTPAS